MTKVGASASKEHANPTTLSEMMQVGMERRASKEEWTLLDAAAWIARREDGAVNVSRSVPPAPHALKELKAALEAGHLVATAYPNDLDKRTIEPSEWRQYEIEVESKLYWSHPASEPRSAAKPKSEFETRIIPKDLVGKQLRYGHSRIISYVDVSSVTVRELWPAATKIKAGKRGRPIEYDWPSIKRKLESRSQRGEPTPVDNADLVFLIRDIFNNLDPDGGPADKTIRDAIKKYDLAQAAGMTGKKGMPQRRGK